MVGEWNGNRITQWGYIQGQFRILMTDANRNKNNKGVTKIDHRRQILKRENEEMRILISFLNDKVSRLEDEKCIIEYRYNELKRDNEKLQNVCVNNTVTTAATAVEDKSNTPFKYDSGNASDLYISIDYEIQSTNDCI